MFFNGDGTVYGRYGSWTHQKNAQDTTTVGYKRALEGALALHKGYPANKASLQGKQGVNLPFKTPVEIPTLAGKYQRELDWNGKVVGSCVHCHQVGDAMRTWYRDQRKPMPDEWIHPWPASESVGITLAPDQVAKVESVASDSIAAKAGVKAGDEFISIASQPLVSIADVSWILHNAPDPVSLAAVLRRDGAEKKVTLELPAGWRSLAEPGKRVGVWGMRGMASGGMVLEDLDEEARQQRGLSKDQLALFVKSVGMYGKHAAAKNAGFQKDDVITEIDGLKQRMSEIGLFDHLLRKRMPGESVATAVLRGKERVELKLPMQ
jgi:membrane-associated protease RseP (regulator of RpoE activity)